MNPDARIALAARDYLAGDTTLAEFQRICDDVSNERWGKPTGNPTANPQGDDMNLDWRTLGKVTSALLMIGAAAAGALQLANVPGFTLSPGATVAVIIYLATVPVATGFLPAPKPDVELPPRG